MIQYSHDKLNVKIYENRSAMGKAAAEDISACIQEMLEEKEELNILFAAAPSQNEMLASLAADERICWNRINAFHMDEYVGIPADAPQGFANFLKNALFDHVPFKTVNLLDCTAEPKAETERYSVLLRNHPLDIVCMGIGENGHIAFNDPHVADFHDNALVKIVDLDPVCRMQQVHDGCFAKLEDVPEYALTLTVPAMQAAKRHFCVVPAAAKANAVKNTVEGEIGEHCPATILRVTDNAALYCDADSASLLKPPFAIGIITDEVSQDLDEALEFAKRYALEEIELRSVYGVSPFAYSDELVQKICDKCNAAGVRVKAISSPLFKCDYADETAYADQVRSFEKLAQQAKVLGAKFLRGFDFWSAGISVCDRAKRFAPIIDICRQYDLTLVLEYDPSVHTSTPERLRELLREIDDPRVKALYDPGNGPYGDADSVPYPDGYEVLKDSLCHIHIKDTALENGKPVGVRVGDGLVDFAGLFRRLYQDGYTGSVMLETHYRLKSELTEDQLKRPGGYGFSEGAYDASVESIKRLLEIVKFAGKEALK